MHNEQGVQLVHVIDTYTRCNGGMTKPKFFGLICKILCGSLWNKLVENSNLRVTSSSSTSIVIMRLITGYNSDDRTGNDAVYDSLQTPLNHR